MGTNDRLGIRWGLAGGVALRSIAQVREVTAYASDAGFESLWISQSTAVDPVVALAATADAGPRLIEVGTSVVPLYGRHPIGLAQMVRTAQSALDGRFTLGIGPSHRRPVEESLGIAWDHPFAFTSDFLDGLLPLLEGRSVETEGTELTTRAELNVDAPNTSTLLAALGPRMLKMAGERVAGTTLGQCGPKTISTYIVPHIHDAAEAAGRPVPRVMALVRVCVTDDHAAAYRQAQEVGAFYRELPSYAAVLEREGVQDPADLHLIGSWEQILDGLAQYAAAGVTDLRIEVVAPTASDSEATRHHLATYLSA